LRRHNFTTYTHTHTFKNHGKTVHFTILFFEDFLFFFKFFVLNFWIFSSWETGSSTRTRQSHAHNDRLI
jgi:hypothetical protein